jgi:hypothetical protein
MKTRILKITGLALLVLIAFVSAAPYLFKGKITSLIKAGMNRDLNAQVRFSEVNISFFRKFPKIEIRLENLQVTCIGEFQGDTLMTARQFNLTCDLRSFISGDSIQIHSVSVNEPRFHTLTNKEGHSNWNIVKPGAYTNDPADSSTRPFKMKIQGYAIHNGYVDYTDERKNIHVIVINLEHEGMGDFSSDLFTLKTKTTADLVQFEYKGAVPYRLEAKTSIDLAFRVDNKIHTYSFNSDQVVFNDMKLHTEGFFHWVNDSSYAMSIQYKTPSTKFRSILSMLPSVYQKDFASIESDGWINFNGFLKGKYDAKHFPAFHTNLYVQNGFFKYPDLPVPVEHINLALQLDNPDGMADHTTINIPGAHAEINHDSLDLHLLLKNLQSRPFIDFAFVGKLDLANISKLIKLESGTRLSGIINADIHAKGNLSETENHKKDIFQSSGSFDLRNFLYASKHLPDGIVLDDLSMSFNAKNVVINEMKGAYLATQIGVTGTLNNLFDFAVRNRPLQASLEVKADDFNLRDWLGAVPDNIDFNVNAEAGKLHYDNLDMQNISCKLVIKEQTVHLLQVKAKGLDGDINMDGTYSTLEGRENPEIAFSYDVKGLDIQKTFLAFNSIRRIVPVGKFIAGNIDAQMTMNGRLHEDMTTDLQTLSGEGHVLLIAGSMKDFGPLDKLSESLDISELKDVPLKNIKSDFSFKAGKVMVSPFFAQAGDIDMEITGGHGFDQSLDYNIKLKVPRNQLGSKGTVFVKNVVTQAADKGIPVQLRDAVNMNVKMGGTINNPDVKPDMDAVVDNAATDLKKEVNDFVNAKLDSAKQQLRSPSSSAKKQLIVQTAYKPKTNVKAKKVSGTAHKKAIHQKAKNKHTKTRKNYTTSLKKAKSIASNRK